jgi:hypothetical protein
MGLSSNVPLFFPDKVEEFNKLLPMEEKEEVAEGAEGFIPVLFENYTMTTILKTRRTCAIQGEGLGCNSWQLIPKCILTPPKSTVNCGEVVVGCPRA